MKYNVAKNSYANVNLIEGNKSLSYNQLFDFVINNNATISLSGTDILSVEVDLGERVFVDEVRYYFSSVFAPNSVVSGISFYARRSEHEFYSLLTPLVGSGYYYATITGTSYAPSQVKLIHTVSGTSISGIAVALQVLNNEDIVNFGSAGEKTFERFDLSLLYDVADVREIPIFNSGPAGADAYITIEPQNNLSDNILQFGATSSGPWLSVLESKNQICGPNRFNSYYLSEYDQRQFVNTYVYENAVELLPGSVSGTYTTCVFGNPDSSLLFTPLIFDREYPIVASGVVFYDNFNTASGDKWQILNGTFSFTNFYLLATSYNYPSIITKSSIFYSYDWECLMKIAWGNTGNASDWRAEFIPFFIDANNYFGVWVRANTNYKDIRFVLNGLVIHTVPTATIDPFANLNTWFWFKSRREFNVLRAKMWKVGDPEPAWFFTYGLSSNALLSKVGYIRFIYNSSNVSNALLADDISVSSYVTASGESNAKIATSLTDGMETVELRSSDRVPLPYHVYTTVTGILEGSNHVIRSTVRYFDTDGIIKTYNLGSSSQSTYGNFVGAYQVCDDVDETIWGVSLQYRTSSAYSTSFAFINYFKQLTGAASSATIFSMAGGSLINVSVKFFVTNKDSGCWLYFYTSNTSAPNGAGYHLHFYNNSLSRTFILSDPNVDFVGGMCLASANNDLWYANNYNNTVLKITTSGMVLKSYDAVGPVRYMCSDKQGGCYFLRSDKIVRLNSNADYVSSIDVDANTTLFGLDKDVEGNFWLLINNTTVVNIDSSGTPLFSYSYYDAFIKDICIVNGGVWLKCSDVLEWKFLGRHTKTITKSLFSPVGHANVGLPDRMNTPVFYSKPFSVFDNRFPLPIDTHWNNLPWRKVAIRNYLLPSKKYHQFRFTLCASNPGKVSPILKSLSLQSVVKVDNIPSGQARSVYVKADISFLNETQLGIYLSNLKVWWYVPE